MTLADLVADQHDLLIERFIDAARRQAQLGGIERVELIDSMAFFLDDLVDALASGREIERSDSAAASHGVERLSIGFRVDRVVREYMLVAQLVLDLAEELGVQPSPVDLRRLLRAVGDGAAIAASEYVRQREALLQRREAEHAGFLAHEVRNSLTSARFAFDLLCRRDFANPVPLVAIVENGLRQAGARIDDALSGARVRGGVVSPVRVYPRLILDEIRAELQPQADARQIALVVEGAERLTAQADARLLRSALDNLATNAIKFSRSGGSVTMRAHEQGEQLIFDVADSCGGIDEATMDRLFRPFVQGGEERSGYGLGLAIARDCAEAQGGSLTLRDAPGQGCVFTLTMPLRP